MEYQEKIERIGSLSEKQLRKDVLVPLFIAMGFQNVIEYHGTTERGKDIIFNETDRLGDKVYYAVVAKTERIHGSIGKAGNVADVVHNQIQQALNEPYVDVYGLRKLEIDKALVVTSKLIVPSCIEAFFETLTRQGLHKCFRCYDGNWLVQQIDRHMETYFEDKSKDEIIKETQAQIEELRLKKDKAIEIVYKVGIENKVSSNMLNVSSTAIRRAESESDFVGSLATTSSGLQDYSETKIKASDILEEFMKAGIMPKNKTCPYCNHQNDIDLNSPFIFCENCFKQIF